MWTTELAPGAAHVLSEPDAGILHLPGSRLTPELFRTSRWPWATPVAPTGCPLALRPPLVFTGMLPPRAVMPSRAAPAPSPGQTSESASTQQISEMEKQSWTSATSMSLPATSPPS